MLQSSAFTLTAPSPAMAGQISRHMVKSGGLGEAMMSLALVLVGVGILAVSARIQVPFYPVPVTMQTLAVMMIAMAYGSKLGTTTLFSYLLAGFLGAPVFAGGAGMVSPIESCSKTRQATSGLCQSGTERVIIPTPR